MELSSIGIMTLLYLLLTLSLLSDVVVDCQRPEHLVNMLVIWGIVVVVVWMTATTSLILLTVLLGYTITSVLMCIFPTLQRYRAIQLLCLMVGVFLGILDTSINLLQYSV